MNFLAHVYLSGNNPDVMLGNFIGDFVRGRDLAPVYGEGIAKGILLHRAIDDFTDHHVVVRKSKDRLRPTYRHYSGVIVDIFYDHFLAAGWEQFSREPLEQFAARVYQLVLDNHAIVPDRVNQLLPHMMRGNWLVGYAHLDNIQRVLTGMSRRSSFNSKMELATEDLRQHYTAFKSEFAVFFPTLQAFCKEWLSMNG
jgi:acyl carrier protein phosphodiesterase